MSQKITITLADALPCPLLYLETTQALAAWYHQQLLDALQRGERTACLHCFASLGNWSPAAGAYAVLRTAVDFLRNHPDMEEIRVCCAGDACFQAHRVQWNMWFAQHRGEV